MKIQHRAVWSISCLLGFLAVALLAIASHAVQDPGIAARVQLVGVLSLAHVPVLLLLAMHLPAKALPAWCMVVGLLLFAIGVLGRALLAIQWPLPVAPAGGVLLMASWLWLAATGAMYPRA